MQPQEGEEGRASKLWCFLWSSLQLTASAVYPCSLCLPQLCQTGEEEQDTNLAKHLKEEHCQQREGLCNDIPQGL